jgi:outer membrane protein assembly factor BamB/pSer/pThr/pTyr-binding forkhead associated (FHA) protein
MAVLKIRYPSGETAQRELSRTGPISIGSHSSSSIFIEDDNVESLHCRISWNDDAYEVLAGASGGVDLNGTLVHQVVLKSGDVLRVGSVDIHVRGLETDSSRSKKLREHNQKNRNMPKSNRATGTPESDSEIEELDPQDVFEESDEDFDELEPMKVKSEKFAPKAEEAGGGGLRNRRASRMRSHAIRPGEEDIIRSKAVWFWGGGISALVLICVILWVVFGRDQAKLAFEDTTKLMEERNFSGAIDNWEKFLEKFPKDSRAKAARIELGIAYIELNTRGGTPDWENGLKRLHKFIGMNKDDPDFGELRDLIRDYGVRIALGSAKAAGAAINRDLLKAADEAANVVAAHSPENKASPEFLSKFNNLVRASQNAIAKEEKLDESVAEIETFIGKKKPMEALQRRVLLIQQYKDLEKHAKVTGLREKILDVERGLVGRETSTRDAIKGDETDQVFSPLSLTFHPRSPAGGKTGGQSLVYCVAQGCCYGLDPLSGDPIWRRVIGFDTPFFPIEVSASVPGVLLFDTNFGGLVLLDGRSGNLIWRQKLSETSVETVTGTPLVHGGQIYLPTQSAHLYKIDLESGQITTKLTFSQQVHAPPVLVSDGRQMVVAGDREVLYTLSLSPLECKRVSYTGHLAGTVEAPLLVMGNLLLMCENDQDDSCKLSVLNLSADQEWLSQLATARVDGQVRDLPVLRGRKLFLPSSEERVAAFQVSDDPDLNPLTEITRFSEKSTHTGPTYLTAGPGDTFWMASNRLRRFQLKIDTIQADATEIAVGVSTQPPKVSGRYLYLGRSLPYSNAVVFEQADAQQMVSNWRTVLGARPLGWSYLDGGFAVCINEMGDLFRIPEARVQQGGFQQDTILQLPLPENLKEPLHVTPLGEGRLGVYSGGEKPIFRIVNKRGQIVRTVPLEKPLQTMPVVLGQGVILPLPGKLKMIGISASGPAARDYITPVGQGEGVTWSQLVGVDETHVLAFNSAGILQRIQLQSVPISSLLEVTNRKLPNPVDFTARVKNGKLFLADSGGVLQMINASTLDTVSELRLDAPVSNSLWLEGNKLFVEVGRDRLQCYEIGSEFKPLWSTPLDGPGLVGDPLVVGNSLLIALQNGDAVAIDIDSGKVTNRMRLGQPAGMGPQQLGKHVIVPSIDGSLYRVDSLLQGEQ